MSCASGCTAGSRSACDVSQFWQFETAKNPARYVPAYGGWCTWAVAELNKRVDVDPEAYVVKNGKLYVFYRDPKLDTRAKFLEDPDGMLARAEANWPALSK